MNFSFVSALAECEYVPADPEKHGPLKAIAAFKPVSTCWQLDGTQIISIADSLPVEQHEDLLDDLTSDALKGVVFIDYTHNKTCTHQAVILIGCNGGATSFPIGCG